jgi:hypothetical protein
MPGQASWTLVARSQYQTEGVRRQSDSQHPLDLACRDVDFPWTGSIWPHLIGVK